MAKHVIKSSEAARNFSDLLNRVRYQGMSFDIQRGREIVARISPVSPTSPLDASELQTAFASLPRLSKEELDAFERDLETLRKAVQEPVNPWD